MDDTKELKVNITLNVVCDCEKGLVKRVEETVVKPTIGSDNIKRLGYNERMQENTRRGYACLIANQQRQMEYRELYEKAEKEYGRLWPVYRYYWMYKTSPKYPGFKCPKIGPDGREVYEE